LIASFGVVGSVRAADPPPVVVAGPAVVGGPVAAFAAPGCTDCPVHGRQVARYLHKNRSPYVTQLAPGACFGYFQTQWHRWEDVCPLPYQAATPAAPVTPPTIPILPPATPIAPKGKVNEAPPPQPGKTAARPPLPPVKPVPGPLPVPPGYGDRR
jgi:hypothetical protein